MDEAFGEELRLACKSGVDIYAYECEVGERFYNFKLPSSGYFIIYII